MQIDNTIQFNLLLMLTLTYVALLIRAGTNDFRDSTFSTWSIPSSAKCTMFGKLHFGNLSRELGISATEFWQLYIVGTCK